MNYIVCGLIFLQELLGIITTKMEEEVQSGSDNIVTEFTTYEDFLSSQITSLDLFYLEVSDTVH